MPTEADGFKSQWLTCFTNESPDQHSTEGCMNVSYTDIASWYSHIRQMGEKTGAQFNSCQYGNFFEFGWNVEQIWPDSQVNCSATAAIENASVQLLCHTQQLLRDKYQTALLHSPESVFNNESGQLVCGGLDGSCGMDPHPSLPYLAHLLDMSRTSMAQTSADAVCIDRQDWISKTNPNADDRKTWLPVKGKGFIPVRAMIYSWKAAMEQFAAVWHNDGRPVIINDHSNRLDMMRHVEGIYAEYGCWFKPTESDGLGSINPHAVGSALATLGPRVAYIWNHYASSHEANHLTYAYLSAGLQTHLWAGVFPTVPIKNNDHAIGGDCAPNCSFGPVFSDFGPLFASMHGREWVLVARAAEVTTANALANLFRTKVEGTGSGHRYVAPVVLAPQNGTVALVLRGLEFGRACVLTRSTIRVSYLRPASSHINNTLGTVTSIDNTDSQDCGGGGWTRGTQCVQLSLSFMQPHDVTRRSHRDMGLAAAVVVIDCAHDNV